MASHIIKLHQETSLYVWFWTASIGAPKHCLCHYELREVQIIQCTDVPGKVQLWPLARNCFEICNWCIFVFSHVTMMIHYHYYYIIRSSTICGICQLKKCLFISCYQIFPSYIRLVISAMQFQIKSSLRKILFQPNLSQLFRFWKWNKTWLKMCTKDRTPETDQSFTLKPFSHHLFWKQIWNCFWKQGFVLFWSMKPRITENWGSTLRVGDNFGFSTLFKSDKAQTRSVGLVKKNLKIWNKKY